MTRTWRYSMDRFKPSKVAARWAILDVISARLISCAQGGKKAFTGGVNGQAISIPIPPALLLVYV